MIRKRPQVALFLSVLPFLFHLPADAESEGRYRMYRNPPKPRIALLPLESRGLEIPARDQVNQAMANEIRKLKDYHLVPLPESVLDSQGKLPPGALAVLKEKHRVDLVLHSRLEHAPERNVFFLEFIDTRKGHARSRFRKECLCPLDEVVSRMVPESVRNLTGAPGLKGLRCKDEMAVIPAPMAPGSTEPDSLEGSWGPGAFCIDLFEYPNRSAGEPVVEKTWNDAKAICEKEGKRLCTEGEWELACGGWKESAYPYGASYDQTQCNTQSVTIQLSGGNAGCRSPFGVFDLSGNVYEWTSSNWSPKYKDKVVKGGNWSSGAENSACKVRFGQSLAAVSKAIGFRCCMTLVR